VNTTVEFVAKCIKDRFISGFMCGESIVRVKKNTDKLNRVPLQIIPTFAAVSAHFESFTTKEQCKITCTSSTGRLH
jgi:hypothetical protein